MAIDLEMSVVVTRTQLALPDLQINDFVTYYVGSGFLGETMAWVRETASSAFLDGAITTSRRRGMVSEPMPVEVLGDTPRDLQLNMNDLIKAFEQSLFNVIITIGTGTHAASYTLVCESADHQMEWTGPRWVAIHGKVSFTVPCQPRGILYGAF